MESSGSKSLVNPGQSTYIFYVRFNHFLPTFGGARGRNGGRPRKLKTKDIQTIKALMHAGELPVQDIADRFGVARSTLYRNAARPESLNVLKTHAIQTRAS